MLFAVTLLVLAFLSVFVVFKVKKDYETRKKLSTLTVTCVWMLYFVYTAVVIYASYSSLWPIGIDGAISLTLGIIFGTIGILFIGFSLWEFRSFKKMSGMETNRVIASGIYRWSRNPQNVGLVLFLLGISFWGASLGALLLVAVFAGVFHSYVPIEEKYLSEALGKEYDAYCTAVPRYFSFPGKV